MTNYVKGIFPANGDISGYVQQELSRIQIALSGGTSGSSGGGGSGTAVASPGLRLSLTPGVAVTTVDVIGATTVLGVPTGYNSIVLWDGSQWVPYSFSTDRVLALDTTAHVAAKGYSVFAYFDGADPQIGTGPAWATDTTVGTGAGTAETTIFQGREVNKYDISLRRAGGNITIGANKALLVGGFGTSGAGTTDDSYAKRLLSNYYNLEDRPVFRSDTTDSWAGAATSAWRQANGSSLNQIEVFFATSNHMVEIRAHSLVGNSTGTGRTAGCAIGLDSSSTPVPNSVKETQAVDNTRGWPLKASYTGYPGQGRHTLRWLELSGTVDTRTWYGDNGDNTLIQTGLVGSVVN